MYTVFDIDLDVCKEVHVSYESDSDHNINKFEKSRSRDTERNATAEDEPAACENELFDKAGME